MWPREYNREQNGTTVDVTAESEESKITSAIDFLEESETISVIDFLRQSACSRLQPVQLPTIPFLVTIRVVGPSLK